MDIAERRRRQAERHQGARQPGAQGPRRGGRPRRAADRGGGRLAEATDSTPIASSSGCSSSQAVDAETCLGGGPPHGHCLSEDSCWTFRGLSRGGQTRRWRVNGGRRRPDWATGQFRIPPTVGNSSLSRGRWRRWRASRRQYDAEVRRRRSGRSRRIVESRMPVRQIPVPIQDTYSVAEIAILLREQERGLRMEPSRDDPCH